MGLMSNAPERSQAFDLATINYLRDRLAVHHERLAQLHRAAGSRSLTAKNYDVSIMALIEYMQRQNEDLPTKSLLTQWRDDMVDGVEIIPPADRAGKPRKNAGGDYAVKTINARLSAVRSLLLSLADDVSDLNIKMTLRDWATVRDAPDLTIQDYSESDYGVRLEPGDFEAYINRPDPFTLKGLRDRALIAVMGGAGLRVHEAVALRVSDVGLRLPDGSGFGIRVRRGKHDKRRIVAVGSAEHWVFQAIDAYRAALPIKLGAEDILIRGVGRGIGDRFAVRSSQHAIAEYPAKYLGEWIRIAPHDLRRTFGYICHYYLGVPLEVLRAQYGHSSVVITEMYIGKKISWSARVLPEWKVGWQ